MIKYNWLIKIALKIFHNFPIILRASLILLLIFYIFLGKIHAAEPVENPQEPAKAEEPIKDNGGLSKLELRIKEEKRLLGNRFAIIPHKPTYILPITYNPTPNNESFEDLSGDADKIEMKFQISLKIALWREIFSDNSHLFFAYTQQSFWQAYNSLKSAPFRETNYEPELMLRFYTDYNVFGFKNRIISFGFVHQSNGRGGTLSRSWNRVCAEVVLEKGNFYLSLKPWYRIPESKDSDNNPDIDEYVGHGEIRALYAFKHSNLGLLLRNNLRSHNRWGVQFDWTFPLGDTLKGYAQYYTGYGENLIDYNHINNRIGFGILITDWL